jgi:hypothetical protein
VEARGRPRRPTDGPPVSSNTRSNLNSRPAKTSSSTAANGIDSDVQKKPEAKKVRIQFGSQEYLDLAANKPKAQGWLALGTGSSVPHG